MRTYKDIYFKTSKELKDVFFKLFDFNIHIPYNEYKKLDKKDVISLEIRNNYFTFMEE